MAFNPSSTIYLCYVPIDSTYQNEIYFADRTEQQEYFKPRVRKTFSNYLTVRTNRADGSLQSSVKVNENIDVLRSLPVNYMYYQNANHGTRYFYAFITSFVYINENTTEIFFETDVYQTWLFDARIMPSYVVREHSETDEIGDNLVPEKFTFQDYVYQVAHESDKLNEWGYLVTTTDHGLTEQSFFDQLFGGKDVVVDGKTISGVYQGLFFWFFKTSLSLNTFLNDIIERLGECVVSISVVPSFSIGSSVVHKTMSSFGDGEGYIGASTKPAETTDIIEDAAVNGSFEGYAPKNNKMFTSPFYKLIVTNHSGDIAEYNIEDFSNPDRIHFALYGDISASPSLTLIPCNYKGLTRDYDSGISISGFPQVSFNTDTFKLWLTKNQFGTALQTAASVGTIVGGAVSLAAAIPTGGASLLAGAGMIAGGAGSAMSTINGVYQASKEPNRAHGTGVKNNLLTAMGKNKFEYYIQTMRRDHAITVDNFFTMYGYQTNKIKQPNVSARPYFNYVQTSGINILGAIPCDDMEKLRSIYDKGITLWKKDATIGFYDVDNRPVKEG